MRQVSDTRAFHYDHKHIDSIIVSMRKAFVILGCIPQQCEGLLVGARDRQYYT